jgi:hypothetical protein
MSSIYGSRLSPFDGIEGLIHNYPNAPASARSCRGLRAGGVPLTPARRAQCPFKGNENCGASEGVWVACDSAPCGELLTPVTGLRLVNKEATLVGPQYAASGGVTAAWSAYTGADRQIFMPASGVLQVPSPAEHLVGAHLGLGRVATLCCHSSTSYRTH